MNTRKEFVKEGLTQGAVLLGVFVGLVVLPLWYFYSSKCSINCQHYFLPLPIAGCAAVLWANKKKKIDSVFWYVLASGLAVLITAYWLLGFKQ